MFGTDRNKHDRVVMAQAKLREIRLLKLIFELLPGMEDSPDLVLG